ncbi:MAG: hypothetical protein KHY12_08945 [Firmicutes bacterium]|nr:hypothetical protein [Bacillota bacterium]
MAFVMKNTDRLLSERKMKEAQRFVDSEVLRRCDPMVPKETGMLIGSGIRSTEIGSGKVKYATPYARRWYYIPAHFTGAPMRGNYWFERMKNNGGRWAILRGTAKITGGRSR